MNELLMFTDSPLFPHPGFVRADPIIGGALVHVGVDDDGGDGARALTRQRLGAKVARPPRHHAHVPPHLLGVNQFAAPLEVVVGGCALHSLKHEQRPRRRHRRRCRRHR